MIFKIYKLYMNLIVVMLKILKQMVYFVKDYNGHQLN